ncbi:BMP family protein [Sediminispirochaeta smaragdinae]|jgi:basic membrane protein A|uniref:Basic membrane lipoprotein n=1 Tax=Sediminispirochaeta smaragdinae (strain DSM 11293 / JCM 15392 / SEBR 4228) TaxID=573413 RepID=E1R2M7_SEDSS|nr:BMP family protein [Sediminispirochaeta smaragdinae]ADK80309.1 basic membrane lipoprotein [Sediminispirochaeta smaragdinae DSM 11293]
MKRGVVLAILFFLLAAGMLFAAGSQEASEEEALKVALALPGPISDNGWSASAYEGLMMIEENYGAEVSYTENVSTSDMEDVFRSYSELGYSIIFGHGSQFTDAIHAVAGDYPDIQFIIINGNSPKAPNIACIQVADDQQGFMMGAVAALLTKTGTIGVIGGVEIPPIKMAVDGYMLGAKYADPNVEVLSTLTGSFDDVAKAKETALAMIGNGADIVGAIANQAGLGSIEGCKERGVMAVGSNQDQNPVAPDTVVVSVVKSIPVLFTFAFEKMAEGSLEPKVYRLGVNEGAVYLSSWHGFEDKVPAEVKAKLETIKDEVGSGTVKTQP